MNPRTPLALCFLALALTHSPARLYAQTTELTEAKPSRLHPDFVVKTYYLSNIVQQNDANEILVTLRNMMDPSTKAYLVASQNAIVLDTTPEQHALAQKIIADLDRPRKTYRLTFTLTEEDGGKRVGTQHYSIVVVSGQKTVMKQGSKVPVMTGKYNTGAGPNSESAAPGVQTQFTYLDIGMNFDVTVVEMQHGGRLHSHVEQSNIAEEKSGTVEQDPVVRQTVLESDSFLTLGKPLVLGSIDIPGTTRRVDVEAMLELIPEAAKN